MVEMFTIQRFLDPEGLKSRGLEHFDAWAATFGEVVDTMEISPDGAGLRPRSRFARFTNLPELQQMFRAFTDVQTAEMLNLPRPELETGKPIVHACPCSRRTTLMNNSSPAAACVICRGLATAKSYETAAPDRSCAIRPTLRLKKHESGMRSASDTARLCRRASGQAWCW